MTDSDPTLTVARDLREIARLADMLEDQALHHADDREIPGGQALIQAAPVANQESWANRFDTAEREWLDRDGGGESCVFVGPFLTRPPDPAPQTEDDEETAFQLLEFWWETFGFDLDVDLDRQPSLSGAAEWLASPDVMRWAESEERFDAYVEDIATARRILENVLAEGVRQTPGVHCPRCLDRGLVNSAGETPSMVRVAEDRLRRRQCVGHRGVCPWPLGSHGCSDRGGLQERWVCPVCEFSLGLKDYESAVMRDYIANAPYLRAEHIERRTFIKPGTVRVWASREDQSGMRVRTRKDSEGRTTYCVEDVEAMRNAHADGRISA